MTLLDLALLGLLFAVAVGVGLRVSHAFGMDP